MGEKLDETEDGYYEQVGDVREWRWKDKPSVVTTETASAVVPPKTKKAVRKPKAK